MGKSSSSTAGPVTVLVYGVATFVVLVVGSVTGYLAHGYGLI